MYLLSQIQISRSKQNHYIFVVCMGHTKFVNFGFVAHRTPFLDLPIASNENHASPLESATFTIETALKLFWLFVERCWRNMLPPFGSELNSVAAERA